MTHKESEYMHWAKTQSQARFNLATSGVGAFPLRELEFDCARLEINGDNSYGYKPLKQAIADHDGVDVDCVMTAQGTSMANYLAMATVLEPGDEVLIEQPAYGLLLDAALQIGATVRRFPRREEHGWAIDPEEVQRAMTPKTRLVVVTNLHNPTSVLTPEDVMSDLARIADEAGATLLVDEVYRDAVYQNTPRSAFHLGENVMVTSSLTKVYGVSGLRCGWILAQPDLVLGMRALNNVFASTPVHPGEILSLAVFEKLDLVRDRARRVVEADRAVLAPFLDAATGVSAVRTDFGTTCFLKLKSGSVADFLKRLRQEHETSAVPGRYFETPDHFRIGMGVSHATFVEGLRRLSAALAEG